MQCIGKSVIKHWTVRNLCVKFRSRINNLKNVVTIEEVRKLRVCIAQSSQKIELNKLKAKMNNENIVRKTQWIDKDQPLLPDSKINNHGKKILLCVYAGIVEI